VSYFVFKRLFRLSELQIVILFTSHKRNNVDNVFVATLQFCSLNYFIRGKDMFRNIFTLACVFLALLSWNASAASVYILSGNTLYTGIDFTETLVGIDVRPQTQRLYALGVNVAADRATLYHVSPETGFAAMVGTIGSIAYSVNGFGPIDFPDPSIVGWGFDFDPASDRVRVVAGGLSFRINPSSGRPVDGEHGGAPHSSPGTNPDGPINGGTTSVDAAAYTNNEPNNGNVTTLYTLDAATNGLFIQNPQNLGTQTSGLTLTLNGSPLDFSHANGFDIAPGVNAPANGMAVSTGSGIALLTVGGTPSLFSIDLTTGAATLIGTPNVPSISGFCIRTELGTAVAMSADGQNLLRFSTSSPSTVTTQAMDLFSVVAGETLVGLDCRLRTGQFYTVGIDATANTGTLYQVDPQTGAVTVAFAGTQSSITFAGIDFPDPATTGYSLDFDPAIDRLRVTTSTGLNFRVNPSTNGSPLIAALDSAINGNGSTGISGSAYSRSFPNILVGQTTDLYTLDTVQDMLFVQSPANSGTQIHPLPITLNGQALDLTHALSFDIPPGIGIGTPAGSRAAAIPTEGWIAGTVSGVTGLYRLNLATGAATLLGSIGTGSTPLAGFTVFTTPSITVQAPVGTEVSDGVNTLAFGSTPLGTSATRTVQINNSGSQVLQYSAAATGVFAVTQNATGSIAAGGSATLTLTLAANAVGTPSGTLTITNSDTAFAEFDVLLTGTIAAGVPTVTTPTSASVASYSATLGGDITTDGGAALTERGVVVSATAANMDPLIDGSGVTKIVATGTATGVFTTPVEIFSPGVAYSFKAYAINSSGAGYSTVGTFITLPTAPTVTSPTNTDLKTVSATLGGTVEFGGGAALTERGIVIARLSENTDPLINGKGVTKVVAAGTAIGHFTTPVMGLSPVTAYVFKAYATNSVGTTYSSTRVFSTINNNPAFTSLPTATPNPAGVGQTVTLNVAATDADGHEISFGWSVNGVTLAGASATTVFTAPGTYTATVTASDAFGGSASASMDVTVNAPAAGGGNDSDGDGFSDEFEIAAGFNPSNAANSPTGGVAPVLEVLKLEKLDFSEAGSDQITFGGTLDLPAGFAVANKTAIVDIGGNLRSITFTADGKLPAKSTSKFKLKIKSKKGMVEAQMSKYSMKLLKGDFDAALADEGLVNADTKDADKTVLIRVVFDGVINQQTQALKYSAKAGKTGSAKAAK
jgi:hypothetical protein